MTKPLSVPMQDPDGETVTTLFSEWPARHELANDALCGEDAMSHDRGDLTDAYTMHIVDVVTEAWSAMNAIQTHRLRHSISLKRHISTRCNSRYRRQYRGVSHHQELL